MNRKGLHMFHLNQMIIGFLCLSLENGKATETNFKPEGQLMRGIRIAESYFAVNDMLSPVRRITSRIVCGAHFLNVNDKEDLPRENGFHYDTETGRCEIGNVSFPVQELDNGGILVYGIIDILPSSWSAWSQCEPSLTSPSCCQGVQWQTRNCSSPFARSDGTTCTWQDLKIQSQACDLSPTSCNTPNSVKEQWNGTESSCYIQSTCSNSAFDGVLRTMYHSLTPMRLTEWIRIDLSMEFQVEKILVIGRLSNVLTGYKRNFGIKSLVDDTFCHQMPSSPFTYEFNYLHICDNGPICGRVIELTGVDPDRNYLQIAEVYVWDRPQPEDHSWLHALLCFDLVSYDGPDLIVIDLDSVWDCQEECANHSECNHFSFTPEDKKCHLKEANSLDKIPFLNTELILSGGTSCKYTLK